MPNLLQCRLTNLAGAIACFALGAVSVGLVPLASADSSAGAALTGAAPAMTVNRALKGDRLPARYLAYPDAAGGERWRPDGALMPEKIPVGCDASFSPVSTPALALVYGRCMT
jgi:hypothetical protein